MSYSPKEARTLSAGSPAAAERLTKYARSIGFDGIRGTRLTVVPEGGWATRYVAKTDQGESFAGFYSEDRGKEELDYFASMYVGKKNPGSRGYPTSWQEIPVDPGWPRTWISGDNAWAIEDRGGSFTLYDTNGMGLRHDWWSKRGDYGSLESAKRAAASYRNPSGPSANPAAWTQNTKFLLDHFDNVPGPNKSTIRDIAITLEDHARLLSSTEQKQAKEAITRIRRDWTDHQAAVDAATLLRRAVYKAESRFQKNPYGSFAGGGGYGAMADDAFTQKGKRMIESIEAGGVDPGIAIATTYARAKEKAGTGLVKSQWAREHGYPSPRENPGNPAWGEPKQQWVFKTKTEASAFRDALKKDREIRLDGKISVRKSLPEFRGGGSPGYSVFFKGLGLMDTSAAATLARSMGGRKWSTQRNPTKEPALFVREGYIGPNQWRQLILVTDGRTTTIELTPALLSGWNVTRIDVSEGDDAWPGMTQEEIVRWIEHNRDDQRITDPARIKEATALLAKYGAPYRRPRQNPVENPPARLDYGTLPSREEFAKVVTPNLPFYATLRGADADAAAEVDYYGDPIDDPDELYDLIEALTADWEEGSEDAGDLASGIMQVSGFEWV